MRKMPVKIQMYRKQQMQKVIYGIQINPSESFGGFVTYSFNFFDIGLKIHNFLTLFNNGVLFTVLCRRECHRDGWLLKQPVNHHRPLDYSADIKK